MGEILRRAVEVRRKRLINRLVAFQVYDEGDEKLLALSLTELENEYKLFKQASHPHHNLDSLKRNDKFDRSDA